MGRPRSTTNSTCIICNKIFYRRLHGREKKPKYCSPKCYWKSGNQYFKKGHKINVGRKFTREQQYKKIKSLIGHKVSLKTREKISNKLQGNIPWNKGKKSLYTTERIKNCWKGRIWKNKVKSRDKKCVICGSNERLEADHIKPVFLYPELAYEIDNGRTLCHECHKKTDTFGGRVKRHENI